MWELSELISVKRISSYAFYWPSEHSEEIPKLCLPFFYKITGEL